MGISQAPLEGIRVSVSGRGGSIVYDVIVVGARCSGAPTAMLLARHGYRVLLLDRARFPRDTLSTLYIHVTGAACLARWGLLEAVLATGCPPLTGLSFLAPGVRIEGPVPVLDGVGMGCAPRRYALDMVLAEAAVQAGAEFRQEVSVTGLHWEDGVVSGVRCRLPGGGETVERARLVIGADGRNSTVARLVGAPFLRYDGRLTRAWYAYWSGIADERLRLYTGRGAGAATLATGDGLSVVVVQFPRDGAPVAGQDRQRAYLDLVARASPELRQSLSGACQEDRLYCCSDLPNFFRRPCGPGWALVGDAAHHKDPVGARGIADALQQAELLARVLAGVLGDRGRISAALRSYAAELGRRFTGAYENALQLARFQMSEQELDWLRRNQSDPAFRAAFLEALAGVAPPAER